jgi:hypothetical protein
LSQPDTEELMKTSIKNLVAIVALSIQSLSAVGCAADSSVASGSDETTEAGGTSSGGSGSKGTRWERVEHGIIHYSDDTDAGGGEVAKTYQVKGNVSGLPKDSTLKVSGFAGKTPFAIAVANGAFKIESKLEEGAAYDVVIDKDPTNTVCGIKNGSGTIAGDNAHVEIECKPAQASVKGTASGLQAPVTLTASNGEEISVSQNGSFAFAKQVNVGEDFSVKASGSYGQRCKATTETAEDGGKNVTVACEGNAQRKLVVRVTSPDPIVIGSPNTGYFATGAGTSQASLPNALDFGTRYDLKVRGYDRCTIENASGVVGIDQPIINVECK